MSVTRRIANRRTIAHAALMASASFLSLTFASEAQAQCVTNNTDPVSNVTTDGTIVTCTGAVVSQTVQATANQVDVEISGGATVSGGSNIFVIGDQNEVYVRSGGSLIASTVYTLGANSGVVVQGNVDAAGITVDGAGSGLFLDTNGIINIAPGNLSVFGAVNASNNITLRGTLSGSSSTGSYLLRGGNGQQRVFLSGTINVQADGLAMDLGNDNDEIYLQAGAVLTGGTNNNILIDGGAGNDRLEIDDSGLSHFSTIGIETLVLDPGTGGFRGLSGSHADVTRFVAASGTVNVTNLAALGQTNSNVLIVAGSHLRLSQVGGGAFDHVLAGEGMLSLNSAGSAYTFGLGQHRDYRQRRRARHGNVYQRWYGPIRRRCDPRQRNYRHRYRRQERWWTEHLVRHQQLFRRHIRAKWTAQCSQWIGIGDRRCFDQRWRQFEPRFPCRWDARQ